MGALNPLFLVAAVAVAVPVFLHLFQRHETRRFAFPALRYLERTEKEHARKIRLRQLLLLLARAGALLLVVGAGARLVFAGRGSAHDPTATVIVVDNSLSSGYVAGESRVLDELRALALESLSEGTDDDTFWLIRAGEPWLPAIPGDARTLREAVAVIEPSDAQGDLTAAIERAVELLATADAPNREIHLLSDLQATGFSLPGDAPAGDVPVVVWARDDRGERENRALVGALVGGGLPPLAGQRTELTVSAYEEGASAAEGTDAEPARWPVRVVLDGRIRGAGELYGGTETSIALPPSGTGWTVGYADTDADALRADDRRHFAYRSRGAPPVAVAGTPSLFLREAVSVLRGSSRAREASPRDAELLLAQDGEGLDARGPATASVVVPSADPTLLPALSRRLAAAGIPWRYEPTAASGETPLVGSALPRPLVGVRVRSRYALVAAGEAAASARTLAEAGGAPWALEGSDPEGRRYLLLASPLTAEATSLPVSTGMVRFIDWATNEWSDATGGVEYTTGEHLPAPAEATTVRFPSGAVAEIDRTRTVRGTGEAGPYTFLNGDSVVAVVAVNPPAAESRLRPLERDALAAAIGPEVTRVDDADSWTRAIYRTRRGPELWWPLLLAAALLLVAESLLAASGSFGGGRRAARTVEASGASS